MGDDLTYRIKTEADVSGAKRVEEAFAKLREEAGKFDSRSASGVLGKIAEFGSYAAALETAKKAIEEYAAAEQQVAALDAALAARAQLTDNYRVSLQHLADAQQALTGVDSQSWLGVLTTLTQAGGDAGNIKTLVDATKNLAGILGGDLQSAAFAVGKALNGEFAAFTRIGIVIDETAPKAKKLDELFEQLAQRGGGQLEARTETLRGAFGQLGNATRDLAKGFGGALVTILPVRETILGLAASVKWLSGIFSDTIPKADSLRNAVLKTGAAMESQEDIVKRYTKQYEALKNAAAQAATELDRVVAAIRAKADQEKGIKNAQTDALLKSVDADEKNGRLTPTQAAEKRAKIRKDADDENFKRDKEARNHEIGLVQGQADQIHKQVDEANKKAADEKNKLDEMQGLAHQRANIDRQGQMLVGTAQYFYDNAKSPKEKQAAKKALDEAQSNARKALIGFDLEHGPIDVATQAAKAKQAKETADKANKELYPQGTALTAKAIELQREQAAEMRKHGWENESNREDAFAAIKEARAKELGKVEKKPDGSYQGSPAAIKHQQDIDAAVNNTPQYPPDSPAQKFAIAARDRQIKQLKDIIKGLENLGNLTSGQDARLKAALDRIDVLESQNRNRSNR